MSSVQPITLDEQDHYLATRRVRRGAYHAPAKHRARRLDGPAVARTLATFGSPDDLPGFRFPIGSKVQTTNGTTEWTVVAQAETPAGTSPRSYRATAGRMERVFGEDALRAAEEPKKMTVIDVALNRATGQIEPVSPATGAGRRSTNTDGFFSDKARQELKSMLVASVAPTLAPSIDEPALFTVEPMTSRFTKVESWKSAGKPSTKVDRSLWHDSIGMKRAPKPRANAPFAPTAVITVLVANPKKPGSKSHARFALYASGRTVGEAIASGVTVADLKWDAAHGFIRVS